MDAHVFRRVCDALIPLLTGSRLEKIRSPDPQVHVFSLFTGQRKLHLFLRAHRRFPFLFIAPDPHATGRLPDAPLMRLRKYLAGRRIAACLPDWPARRLHLLCGGGKSPPEGPARAVWLTLDLREGPRLLLDAAPPSLQEPAWPTPQALDGARDHWRDWPVLTPALRRALPLLEPLEQDALLADLVVGGGDLFVYTPDASEDVPAPDNPPQEIFAWPLPDALRKGRQETVFDDPLAATTAVGRTLVLGGLAQAAQRQAAAPYHKEATRLERLLQKLDAEEERLRRMAARQEEALALQAHLWRFPKDAKMAALDLPAVADAPPRRLTLDPRLTLGETMEAWFHTAARGRRGLEFLEQRRARVLAAMTAARQAEQGALLGVPAPAAPRAAAPRETTPKGVQAFLSSDSFLILRGKDAKGNGAVLRAGAPHDLWLHVEGGPGSHAIIRRAFSSQEIPERTLCEAGALVAARSWQRDSEKADILFAEVRYVKALRGATPGTVRVDKVTRTLRVTVDTSLETALSLPDASPKP